MPEWPPEGNGHLSPGRHRSFRLARPPLSNVITCELNHFPPIPGWTLKKGFGRLEERLTGLGAPEDSSELLIIWKELFMHCCIAFMRVRGQRHFYGRRMEHLNPRTCCWISKYFLQSLFGYLMERLLRESWCRNRVDNSWPNRYRSEINTVHTFGKPSGQSPSSIRIRTAVIYPATVNNVKQYRDLGVLPLRIAVEAANGWKEIYKRIARLDQVSV